MEIKFILNNIEGKSVLDISCGTGYLSKKIVEKHNVKTVGIEPTTSFPKKDVLPLD